MKMGLLVGGLAVGGLSNAAIYVSDFTWPRRQRWICGTLQLVGHACDDEGMETSYGRSRIRL